MPAGGSTRCPNCQAALKLKSAAMAGKTVPCPKCRQPFVVAIAANARTAPAPHEPSPGADDELNFADLDPGESALPAAPAPVRGRVKKPRRQVEPPEEEAQPSLIGKVFRALICVNAHLAIAAVVLESLWELFWMLTHWSEFQNRMVTWRFARAQVARPMLLIASALYVWWQAVVPRDISLRRLVSFFGGGYLFLFGVVAFLIALMANSLYDRPIYAVDWGVVYLGFSLLAFASWGFPPETTLQLAERLTSEGRYGDALTVVNLALERDPGNQDAYDLQRALRDLMRHA